MFQIIGIIVVFVMVFGGFSLAGGHFDVILKAMPFEMMMIGGAAVGAFLIGNKPKTVMKTLAISPRSSPAPNGRRRTIPTCSHSCSC